MSDGDKNRDRAERAFKQAEEGKTAMAEHQAERQALREKRPASEPNRLRKRRKSDARLQRNRRPRRASGKKPPRNQHIRRAAD